MGGGMEVEVEVVEVNPSKLYFPKISICEISLNSIDV